jgi:methylglyoxal/glyoxal reductase
MLQKVVKLNELEIPVLGLGTLNLVGQPCRKLISSGIYLGYKLIDTNPRFKNEIMISEAIKNTSRDNVFIISKIPSEHMDYNSTVHSVEKTLKNMRLEYLDLVLLESPGRAEVQGKSRMNMRYRLKSYWALVNLKNKGLIKNIGVSNFLPRHLDQLWDKFEYNPVANQIEFHPFCYNEEVYTYHKEKNVQIIGSTPLARCTKKLWAEPEIIDIRNKYKVSKAQLMLKWAIQKDVVVIPKTKNPERLKINSNLNFEIAKEDMNRLDKLGKDIRISWNSNTIK